jgi:hypothetical protein
LSSEEGMRREDPLTGHQPTCEPVARTSEAAYFLESRKQGEEEVEMNLYRSTRKARRVRTIRHNAHPRRRREGDT